MSPLLMIAAVLALPTVTLGAAGDGWRSIADVVFLTPIPDAAIGTQLVTSIAQDHAGFMWFATQNGLARWDGQTLRYYRPNSKDPGSLPDGDLWQLEIDARDQLWMSMSSGGIARYVPETDSFVKYPIGASKERSAVGRGIQDDGAGGVWVTSNEGLCRLSAELGQLECRRHQPGAADGLPDNHLSALFRDHRGRLWIGGRTGVARLDRNDAPFTPVTLPASDYTAIEVTDFLEDRHGRIWIGTEHGAYLTADDGKSMLPVPPLSTPGSREPVESIIEGDQGETWLATYGHGIMVVDDATLELTRRITRDPLVPDTLAANTPWSMHRDHNGAIWVGTDHGLNLHPSGNQNILTVFGEGTSGRHVVPASLVESVLSMPDGHVWLGLGTGEIAIVDPHTGRVDMLQAGRTVTGHPGQMTEVQGLIPAPSGDVFIITRNALYRKRPGNGAPHSIPLPAIDVRAGVASAGRLWLASNADGIWTLDLNSSDSDTLTVYAPSKDLTDPRVSIIAPTPGGALWVGTCKGLNYVVPASGEVVQIEGATAATAAIRNAYIDTLLLDGEQRHLWVGTSSGGIYVVNLQHPHGPWALQHLDTGNGLPSNGIEMLLQAADGTIWAGTDLGLAAIDPNSLAVRSIGRAEGLGIVGFIINSGDRASDGSLIFGGDGGIVIVRPGALPAKPEISSPLVTALRVGGKAVPPGLLHLNGAAEPIVVHPDANSLNVEFSALDYLAPDEIRYQSWLAGYDHQWSEADWMHHAVTYTNLPPGSYTLRLRDTRSDGTWNSAERALPVYVIPAWYQTLWFRCAAVLLALALIAVIVHLRTATLLRRQALLERQIADRTAELRESERRLQQLVPHRIPPSTGLT